MLKIITNINNKTTSLVSIKSLSCFTDVTGKYFRDYNKEAQSSEESNKEDLQKALFEISARFCHLEGYEALDAPPPPPEEPKIRIKSKKEKKAEEAPGPSGEEEVKTEDTKTEENDNIT